MHKIVEIRTWLTEQTAKAGKITLATRRPRRGRYRLV